MPRTVARGIERHARLTNYPPASETRSLEDRARSGVKTVFCSDSFAAYRTAALAAVGGFPEDAFFAEDQLVAGQMLIKGWRIAYRGDAEVIHSHGYTIAEEFRRYFDVGVFHRWLGWDMTPESIRETTAMFTAILAERQAADPADVPKAFIVRP